MSIDENILRLPDDALPRGMDSVGKDAKTLLINYSHKNKDSRSQVFLRGILFVKLLHGKKVLNNGNEKLELREGDSALVIGGLHQMFETYTDGEDGYRSVVFIVGEEEMRQLSAEKKLPEKKKAVSGKIFKLVENRMLDSWWKNLQEILDEKNFLGNNRLLALKLREVELLLENTEAMDFLQIYMQGLREGKSGDLLSFMEQNYNQPWSLEEFAARTFRSVSTFRREVEKLFGEPAATWLRRRRLEHARTLLMVSEKNVSEIAQEVGYLSQSRFSEQFRRLFGKPPAKYRELNKTGEALSATG